MNSEAVVLFEEMKSFLEELRTQKPDDRSEVARRYAVTITEYEKMMAYFKTFVVDGEK